MSHGQAITSDDGINATDGRDDAHVKWSEAEMERLRARVARAPYTCRLVAEASTDGNQSLIVVTHGGISIVTDLQHFERDVAHLQDRVGSAGGDHGFADTIVWRNGSAAVLLHEAFGHPLEHRHPPAVWPLWLRIDAPLAMRRASFRDVPLLRMTNLVAREIDAPFVLPRRRIEVHFVDGGGYEPLTEMVSLRIASADLIDSTDVVALAPFEIHQTRGAIARSITGATGDPLRYPGVICSREGQELFVGSWAPLLVTQFP